MNMKKILIMVVAACLSHVAIADLDDALYSIEHGRTEAGITELKRIAPNNQKAALALVDLYIDGKILPLNYQEALNILDSVKSIHFKSEVLLKRAWILRQEWKGKDIQKAQEIYIMMAKEQLSSEAMYQLGEMYANEELGKKDMQKAIDWYRKSADLGNNYARFIMANNYLYGEGVIKNHKKAFEYAKACVLSNEDIDCYALMGMALLIGEDSEFGHQFVGLAVLIDAYKQDSEVAKEWYKEESKRKDFRAALKDKNVVKLTRLMKNMSLIEIVREIEKIIYR